MTERSQRPDPAFTCVDPAWGDRLWRCDEPDLDPDLRDGLAAHLFICDACRLERSTAELLIEASRLGGARPAAPRRFVLLPSLGAAALAAALALVFVLPPTERGPGLRRGEEAPQFIRPVEGEVVRTGAPLLRWSPVAGATAYDVRISEVGGAFVWSTRTVEPAARVPASLALPREAGFRGVVRPVPGDLAGPADITVSFRRAGWRGWTWYRLKAAPGWLAWLGGVGLLGLLGGLPAVRRRLLPPGRVRSAGV